MHIIAPQAEDREKIIVLLQRCGELWSSGQQPNPVTFGKLAAAADPTRFKHFLECKMRSDEQIAAYEEATGGNGLVAVRIYINIPDDEAARLLPGNCIPHKTDAIFNARRGHLITTNAHFHIDIKVETEKVLARIDSNSDRNKVYTRSLGPVVPMKSRYMFE